MKVVHISTSDRGGAGIAAVRLHLALLEQGVESHLLTLYKYGPDLPNHSVYRNADIHWKPIGNSMDMLKKILRKLRWYRPLFEKKAKKYLQNRPGGFENFSFPDGITRLDLHPLVRNADIVHLHWVSEGMLSWPSFFSGLKKPLVWTLHDMNPFTGGCHHADGCSGFSANCDGCPQLIGTVDPLKSKEVLAYKVSAMRQLKASEVRITAPSRWLTQLSQKSHLFSSYKHSTIPNVVDTAIFSPQPTEDVRHAFDLEGKKIILFVAHHIHNFRKGTPLLIEAFQQLQREDVVLCSVGYPADELQGMKNVLQLGYITDEHIMAKWYAMADLFVLSSLAENFPNTISEALCCGTPCVAFETGGIPEQLNESNGVLVKEKNAASLLEGIKTALISNFNRTLIAEEAGQRFGKPSIAQSFIELYRKGADQ